MHYNRFRYYDPLSGQYTQQDPIGLAGGTANLSEYPTDPVQWIDPLGLHGECPKALAPESSLNKRQLALHKELNSSNSMATFRKRDISMSDLQRLTKHTGDEYSMYTLGSRRTIFRGKGEKVRVSQATFDKLKAGDYGKWSGHTHRAGYKTNPGPDDRPMLSALGQKQSAIWPGNQGDKPYLFGRLATDDTMLQAEAARAAWSRVFGQ